MLAAGAAEGLARLEQAGEPFDLLILDCDMPEPDCFQLAEQIKQHPDLNACTIAPTDLRRSAGRCGTLPGIGGRGVPYPTV